MSEYIVIRRYGLHGRDQLTGFTTWQGHVITECGGLGYRKRKAHWVFPSLESARAAARKARRNCFGWTRKPVRARAHFFALPLEAFERGLIP